ncbi:YppG family protein [Bacillus sp. FSL K6-3431]|uniref:YppG family protein n=1 Tax=Bacillus sp. FSL K6-3431 TaxID=2921500 RepID=UPI0030F9562E
MFNRYPRQMYHQPLPSQYYPQSMNAYGMQHYGAVQPRPEMYPNFQQSQAGFYPQMNHPVPPYENMPKGYGHDLFQNPLQPNDGYFYGNHNPQTGNQQGNAQKPKFPGSQTGGHFNSILNSFKSQNGTLDVNKMVNTTGQLVNALNQVSTMAKGIGAFFK